MALYLSRCEKCLSVNVHCAKRHMEARVLDIPLKTLWLIWGSGSVLDVSLSCRWDSALGSSN